MIHISIFSVFLLYSSVFFDVDQLDKEYISSYNLSIVLYKFVESNKSHRIYRKSKIRQKHATAILIASSKSGVSWSVIAGVAYAESRFTPSAVGKLGETGVMQLHGSAPWRLCRSKEKRVIDKKSVYDQYICGAHWLKYSIDECDGSVEQGMSKYLTGFICKPKKRGSLYWIVKRRMSYVERAYKYAEEVLNDE